jgi:hypothetical protein
MTQRANDGHRIDKQRLPLLIQAETLANHCEAIESLTHGLAAEDFCAVAVVATTAIGRSGRMKNDRTIPTPARPIETTKGRL